MTKVTYMSKLSKPRRERIRRREARLADATAATTRKLNPDADLNMISLSKSVSLKSLASLDDICSSASFWSSRRLSSLVASLSWKLLAPSASESGGRDQPIEVNDLGSLPGSPVKQRPFSTLHDNPDNDALSTLNEIRVLHSKVIKGLTNRTNTIIRQQAKRKAIRRKTLTPSTSAASLNLSGKMDHEGALSTPASKVGNQSGTTDSDTTLVSTESTRVADDYVLNVQGSTVLQETLDMKTNISTSPTPLPKAPIIPEKALNSEQAPTSRQRVNRMIVGRTNPKEIIISKTVRAVSEIVTKEDPFVAKITVHPVSAFSPKSVQLPQSPEVRMKKVHLVPFPQSVLRDNSPINRPSNPYLSSFPSGVLNIKENIPPPPVSHARINARGSPRAKKPVRYRDKLPKSLLSDDNGSTRETVSELEAGMTIVRNVDNYLRDARMPTQNGIVNSSTTSKDFIVKYSNDRECPRVINEYDPRIPGGWTGHFESSKQTSGGVQGTFTQKKVDFSNLKRQNPDQSDEAVQTSLSSTLESVSYLMDLVVFPLKLVWRMTYGV